MNAALVSFLFFSLFLLTGCGKTSPQQTTERELNLYIWSAYVSQQILEEFEKQTGIRVHYDTYDSNEALLEKLQSGAADYDVVAPSNESVTTMTKMQLLEELDQKSLPNLKNIASRFRNLSYDPQNRHSIPFMWGTTGIGYNKTKVTEPVDSWEILWDPKYRGRILMLDDAWESIGVALKWKGYSIMSTNPAELLEAKNLLLRQKPLVKMYNSSNFDEILLSGDVWLAHGWSGQLAKVTDQDPNFAYIVPKEGSVIWIDNLAIAKSARHKKEAHQFLNFSMDPFIAAKITNNTGYASPNEAAKAYIKPAILLDKARYPDEATLARCEWFSLHDPQTTQLLDRYWTEIKSR